MVDDHNLDEIPELTQRDLLLMAATAAELQIVSWNNDIPIVVDEEDGEPFEWRPHLDDGDSRRLQMDLGISLIVRYSEHTIAAECDLWDIEPIQIEFPNDIDEFGDDELQMARNVVLLCAASVYVEMYEADADDESSDNEDSPS
jgi:hypothetical protein